MISQKSEKSSEFPVIKWKWVVFCLLALSNPKRTFGKAWGELVYRKLQNAARRNEKGI